MAKPKTKRVIIGTSITATRAVKGKVPETSLLCKIPNVLLSLDQRTHIAVYKPDGSLDTGNIFKFEIAADTLAITMDENSKVESITRSYRLEEKTE